MQRIALQNTEEIHRLTSPSVSNCHRSKDKDRQKKIQKATYVGGWIGRMKMGFSNKI